MLSSRKCRIIRFISRFPSASAIDLVGVNDTDLLDKVSLGGGGGVHALCVPFIYLWISRIEFNDEKSWLNFFTKLCRGMTLIGCTVKKGCVAYSISSVSVISATSFLIARQHPLYARCSFTAGWADRGHRENRVEIASDPSRIYNLHDRFSIGSATEHKVRPLSRLLRKRPA